MSLFFGFFFSNFKLSIDFVLYIVVMRMKKMAISTTIKIEIIQSSHQNESFLCLNSTTWFSNNTQFMVTPFLKYFKLFNQIYQQLWTIFHSCKIWTNSKKKLIYLVGKKNFLEKWNVKFIWIVRINYVDIFNFHFSLNCSTHFNTFALFSCEKRKIYRMDVK